MTQLNHLPGKFIWFEHISNDVQKARGFYEDLFGWTSEGVPVGDDLYHMIMNGGEAIGGFRSAPAGMPNHWASYLSVADVDASFDAAVAAGATALLPPIDHGKVGRGAAVADPTGAALSLWKGASDDRPDTDEIPIGDWYWNELWTTDIRKAIAFYEGVFGYTHDTMDLGPMGTYYLWKSGDKVRAGAMESTNPSAKSLWLPYVHVADCDASVAKANSLGAQILVPPTDIPDVGRFSILLDPSNAAIAVIKSVPMAQGDR